MSGLLGKIGPTAIVAAVTTWCCWGYLGEAGSGEGFDQPGGLPRIALPLLKSAFAPVSDRDPFRPLESTKTVSSQSEAPPATEPVQTTPHPEKTIADLLSGLTLSAVYIGGDRRMALIGGQLCRQGDPLAVSNSTVEPCIVTEIREQKVLIRHGKETIELTYGDSSSRVDSPPKGTSQRAP